MRTKFDEYHDNLLKQVMYHMGMDEDEVFADFGYGYELPGILDYAGIMFLVGNGWPPEDILKIMKDQLIRVEWLQDRDQYAFDWASNHIDLHQWIGGIGQLHTFIDGHDLFDSLELHSKVHVFETPDAFANNIVINVERLTAAQRDGLL